MPFTKKQLNQKKPRKNEVVIMEQINQDKVCTACGKPLLKLKWNAAEGTSILVCNNVDCSKYRQPQEVERKKGFYYEERHRGSQSSPFTH